MSAPVESPAQVRALPLRARTEYLLRSGGLRPRKSLGQNFLTNEGAAGGLARAAGELGLPLVEIGGGLGALTVPLAELGLPLTVYEIDRALAGTLAWLLGDLKHVTVRAEDFLAAGLPPEPAAPAVAVGNLPYLSAGAILQKLWAEESPFTRLVVTVQREVAERLRAHPGTKAWGPLTVLARAHTREVRVLAELGPGSFLPAPKVSSTALIFAKREERPAGLGDWSELDRALRAAFGARRKTLRSSMKTVLKLDTPTTEAVLGEACLDGSRRGETLQLEELIALGQALRRREC